MNKAKILAKAHHRNGIAGDPFDVILFLDEDGTTKVAVDFGDDRFAVLQVDLLARGDCGSLNNSWRGDRYAALIRPLAKNWSAE